jgi:type I restriction enzyme R subunit
MRITGDNPEGKAELDNFTSPEEIYPVIATTSDLMTTGVDAETCKLIVIDQIIKSSIKFKQIIGRGTRINEEYDKYYFTIIDFKKATEQFANPDFDGDPVQIYEPKTLEDSPVPPEDFYSPDEPYSYPETNKNKGKRNTAELSAHWGAWTNEYQTKQYVVNNVEVRIASERVQYYDAEGKLITESLKDYTRKTVSKKYQSLDEFLRQWSKAEKKQIIIEELAQAGVFFPELAQEVGKNYDPFDLICHIVWDVPPLTRQERAREVKKRNYFSKYVDRARKVLDELLDKYADEGIEAVIEPQILKIDPFTKIGTPMEIAQLFGGKRGYLQAVKELETQLFEINK